MHVTSSASNFAVFNVAPDGAPSIRFDSGDGLPDVTEVTAGGHAHRAWAFEAKNNDTAAITVSTTLLDGTVITSQPYEVTFKVGR